MQYSSLHFVKALHIKAPQPSKATGISGSKNVIPATCSSHSSDNRSSSGVAAEAGVPTGFSWACLLTQNGKAHKHKQANNLTFYRLQHAQLPQDGHQAVGMQPQKLWDSVSLLLSPH